MPWFVRGFGNLTCEVEKGKMGYICALCVTLTTCLDICGASPKEVCKQDFYFPVHCLKCRKTPLTNTGNGLVLSCTLGNPSLVQFHLGRIVPPAGNKSWSLTEGPLKSLSNLQGSDLKKQPHPFTITFHHTHCRASFVFFLFEGSCLQEELWSSCKAEHPDQCSPSSPLAPRSPASYLK